MPALSSAQRDAIAALFAAGKVEEGFERLAAAPDLKAVDLPKLEGKTLAALGEGPGAAAFAAGLVSPSASVRRMTRKYAPKVPGAGPSAVVRLVFEHVRPFRKVAKPADGLAGSFSGWATPLGPSVLGAKLSFAVKNPSVAVYSEAMRFITDALENLAAAATGLPDHLFVRACEYVLGLARPYRGAESPIPDDVPEVEELAPGIGASVLDEHLKVELSARVRKLDPAALAALERWSNLELVLEDAVPAGSLEAALQERFRALSEEERGLCGTFVLVAASQPASLLPDGKAACFFTRAAACTRVPEKHRPLFAGTQLRWERQHPGAKPDATLAPEGAHALLAAAPKDSRAPAAAKPEKKKPASVAAAAPPPDGLPEGKPLLDPHVGAPAKDALLALAWLASRLGFPGVWKKLVADAGATWFKEKDAPEPGRAPASVEATIDAARRTIAASRRPSPERASHLAVLGFRHRGADGDYVPEDALDAATWGDDLAALLEPGRSSITLALQLLPVRAIAANAPRWEAFARDMKDIYIEDIRAVSLSGVGRGPGLVPILEPLLARTAELTNAPHGCHELAIGLAILCEGNGAEGRAAAARVLLACRLPEKQWGGKQHHVPKALTALFRRAWARRDADFLGAAFARLLVPMYFKGKKAFIPDEKTIVFEDCAVSEGKAAKEDELPLSDVLSFVARERPKLLEQALVAAGQVASFEKAARALIDAAAALPAARSEQGSERSLDDTVALLEAPDAPVVKSGLAMLLARVGEIGERLSEVMRGLERAMGSSSPGVVQSAAALLGAIAAGHEERRAEALALLEECLASTNVPTLEETLRALVKAAGKSKGPGAKKSSGGPGAEPPNKSSLTKKALARIAQVAKEEPGRLGKLAKTLLGK